MKLHLLVDTCVWLDLAKDYRQLPLLDALETLSELGEVSLIVPRIVVEEFARNKERVIADSKRSLSSHFRLVREAIEKFGPENTRDEALHQINDVDHRIATGGEAINEAIEMVEQMFARSEIVETTDAVKVRAANRAITKQAPFHRQRNGIDDAILIEIYADALQARTDEAAVYAFVTHNIHDFSARGADTRLPHPDLSPFFDQSLSRYATNLGPLIGEFAEDLLDEAEFNRSYSDNPRSLSDLISEERKLGLQIWYDRHSMRQARIEKGKIKVVTREVWEAAPPKKRSGMIVDEIWEGALKAAERTENEIGKDELGPWTDFEWGMLNGKLSAIRWVLGDDWDMLDT